MAGACAGYAAGPPSPGLTSTFARGFISVALRAPAADREPTLEPASGDCNKAPGERTRESGDKGGATTAHLPLVS